MRMERSLEIVKALSDASRLRALGCLLEGPRYAEELAERLDLAPSTISFHLGKLEQAGLVTRRREQYYTIYQADPALLDCTLRGLVSVTDAEREEQEQRIQRYRQKVIDTFCRDGRLLRMPAQKKKRRILLELFAADLEPGREYAERELDALIHQRFDDHCTIRRELCDEGLLVRQQGIYRLAEQGDGPTPGKPQAVAGSRMVKTSARAQGAQEQKMDKQKRKELVRAYKEKEVQAGIYWIRNKVTGRVLLGSSTNLHGPLNSHRLELEIGSHRCAELQRDWNELGPEAFELAIVATVEKKDEPGFSIERALAALEKEWIEKLQPSSERCYNHSENIRRMVC